MTIQPHPTIMEKSAHQLRHEFHLLTKPENIKTYYRRPDLDDVILYIEEIDRVIDVMERKRNNRTPTGTGPGPPPNDKTATVQNVDKAGRKH